MCSFEKEVHLLSYRKTRSIFTNFATSVHAWTAEYSISSTSSWYPSNKGLSDRIGLWTLTGIFRRRTAARSLENQNYVSKQDIRPECIYTITTRSTGQCTTSLQASDLLCSWTFWAAWILTKNRSIKRARKLEPQSDYVVELCHPESRNFFIAESPTE